MSASPTTPDAAPDPVRARWSVRGVLVTLLWFLPPLAVGLWVAAITIPGGSFDPWAPAMVDLDVYRRTGTMLLAGQDITRRNLSVQPTLTARPGLPVEVMVNKDMVLRPYQPLFFQPGSSQ